MDKTGDKGKNTQFGNGSPSKLVNLRIPLQHLRRLNDFARRHKISRSKLLLTGAFNLIDSMEGDQELPTIK